jgi:RNA polymerase sigma-70 factor (ECF subfamily)
VSNEERTEQITQALVEDLYRRYGSAVERRARSILGDRDAAADAVQEVFFRVLQKYEQFRGESSPMTWLYRVTTNHCLNQLRNEKRRGELLGELPRNGKDRARRMELSPDIRSSLHALPEGVAAAGIYYYLDGMTHEEIAALLDVSRRTAGNWVEKFQKHLKKRMA